MNCNFDIPFTNYNFIQKSILISYVRDAQGNVMATYKVGNSISNYYTVNTTVSSKYYSADVVSFSDYYPFGMLMPNRHGDDGEKYRYAFNGKEQDPETMGHGNIYDYGFRIYNPRIAKFLSQDPLSASFPWYTPYQFAGNMPIWAIDLDGLEEKKVTHYLDQHPDGTFFVTKTDVEIKQDVTVVIDGKKYATTDVYYVVDGKVNIANGESLYEEITINGMKPSAAYDYTKSVVEGKFTDDWSFILKGKSNKSSTGMGRWGELISRDLNAPDNTITVTDLFEASEVLIPKLSPVKSNKPSQNNGIKKGGGKNAQHKNQKAKEAAKKQYEDYSKKYSTMKSKPNKTKQDKKDMNTFKRQRDHFKKKMDETGENHSQNAKK